MNYHRQAAHILPPQPITEQEARDLYLKASNTPGAGLEGTIEDGFRYWILDDGVQLLRVHITPAPDDDEGDSDYPEPAGPR